MRNISAVCVCVGVDHLQSQALTKTQTCEIEEKQRVSLIVARGLCFKKQVVLFKITRLHRNRCSQPN